MGEPAAGEARRSLRVAVMNKAVNGHFGRTAMQAGKCAKLVYPKS
jgi:hypothetical protein